MLDQPCDCKVGRHQVIVSFCYKRVRELTIYLLSLNSFTTPSITTMSTKPKEPFWLG